jgi:pimeloyl-ACP methyl ester carboxylesterase
MPRLPFSAILKRMMKATVHSVFRNFTVLFATASLALGTTASSQAPGVSTVDTNVTYHSQGIELSATISLPRTSARVPGVVIVHGSGPSTRQNEWTAAWTKALTSQGIAVLHPDKRGSGSSKGDWRTASLEDLAADASAAVRVLRAANGVDSSRVGVIGFSQGGKVVAILAADDSLARFAGVISSSTNTFREQLVDEIVSEARQRSQPLDSTELAKLSDVYEHAFAVARDGGWNAFQRTASDARAYSPRLAFALRTLPPDSAHWSVGFIRAVGDFNPMTYWKRARVPAFFLLGGRDTQVDVPRTIETLWAGVGQGNPLFSMLVLQGSGHAIFRDDALAFVSQWVKTLAR